MLPKDSIFLPIVKRVTSKSIQGGLVEKIVHSERNKERLICNADKNWSAVGVETIFTAFFILLMGALCSFFCLFMETVKQKPQTRLKT